MIDNPMLQGTYATPTDYFCPRCKAPLDYEATVYEWGEDWICGECLVDAVHSLSREDRAEMAGEEICYTEQQLEAYHGSAGAYADIFDITTNRVEDIA